MGMYISVYIADWVRLAQEIERYRRPRSYRLGVGYFDPEPPFDLLVDESYPLWGDTDSDGLSLHPDGWMARFDWGLEKDTVHLEFEHIWTDTYHWVQDEEACGERGSPDVYSCEAGAQVIEDLPGFLRLVEDVHDFLDTDGSEPEPARWRELSGAIGGGGLYYLSSPARVADRAQAWSRISGRLEELRPFVELHLAGNYRITEYSQFVARMRKWARVIELAHGRGWGMGFRYT
ncbi:hypothetical protein [Nocardia carnea]|nr:hypothetical protein [Nocardia carnea]